MSSHDISPLTRIVTRLDRLRDGEVDSGIIPTGFPSVDRSIAGGLRRGDLIVLGGDHRVGCSSLALAMALRIHERTLFLTSEMPAERAYERALAMSARVSLDALRLGVVEDDERARMAAVALSLRERALVIDVLRGGVKSVEAAAGALPTPAVLIVDGLESLLDREETARDDTLSFAVLSLKRFAVQHNCAVVLLSHLPAMDHARRDKRPVLADFGVRGAVGVHADLVLGLYREELYDADLGVAGAAELRLLKQRDGALGYVDLYFTAPYMKFEDVLDG